MFVDEKAKGEPAKVGTLKLSEAIRIGAKKRPQCRGAYFNDYGESCALGAAAEALFGVNRMTFGSDSLRKLQDLYGDLTVTTVIFMNDGGGQTREQIADWLESRGF